MSLDTFPTSGAANAKEKQPDKVLSLKKLRSREPISGFGYERFSDDQLVEADKQLSIILSKINVGIMNVDDARLDKLPGEAVKDFQLFLETSSSEERKILQARIEEAIRKVATEED